MLRISLVDVTRMRRLESMRSEFAANVSHELRTPITNIKGYVETLLQVGVDDPTRMQRFLEIIHRNTVRLSGIVEDILTLAFLEEPEARQTIARAPVPADEIVAQVVEDLETAAAVKSIAIEVRGLRDAWVLANRSLAEQALANLVSNAIKYTTEGTTVSVEVAEDGEFVRMAVIDRGPGIAPKHLPRLFERFYRIDRSGALTLLKDVEVGYLPDGIAFSEDGRKLVIANEGEPIANYAIDRPGSIGIIDIKGKQGKERFTYTDLGFAGLTLPTGIRISGPAGTTQATDIEPEYVSILGNYAYVTLQENNGVAKVNLKTNTIETITANRVPPDRTAAIPTMAGIDAQVAAP